MARVYGSPYDNFPVHRMFDKGISIFQGQAPVHNYIDHLISLVSEGKVVLAYAALNGSSACLSHIRQKRG